MKKDDDNDDFTRRQGALATSHAVIEGLPAPLVILQKSAIYVYMYAQSERKIRSLSKPLPGALLIFTSPVEAYNTPTLSKWMGKG
jgi:hypothetical protein